LTGWVSERCRMLDRRCAPPVTLEHEIVPAVSSAIKGPKGGEAFGDPQVSLPLAEAGRRTMRYESLNQGRMSGWLAA
jgi:hypothetical protein